jgi:response regulator NasT
LNPIRVVIADDESIIRMDLREMLTSLGYAVVGEAGDGQAAVAIAREVRPDLVIMDEERLAPVLLLTAFSEQDLIARAREAGVVGYLVKPFRESDLPPAIEVAVARFNEFRSLEIEATSLRDQIETRKVVERAKGILMQANGLSEAEAFRRIQTLSMNSRKPMRQVAEAILLTHQV